MNSEEYLKKVKEFSEELSNDIDEINPSYAESECLYSLKNYIDKRFELLTKYLGQHL